MNSYDAIAPEKLNLDTNGNPILFECPFFKIVKQGRYFVLTEAFDVNAAVVIAQNANGEFLLARLNRPAIGTMSLEFPRGGRDAGEDTEKTATREFLEETGYTAESAQRLGSFHSNTSMIRSSVDVFLVKGAFTDAGQTDGEVEDTKFVSMKDLLKLVASGQITDAHTLSAITLLLAHQMGEEGSNV